jgi:hypothetical protein
MKKNQLATIRNLVLTLLTLLLTNFNVIKAQTWTPLAKIASPYSSKIIQYDGPYGNLLGIGPRFELGSSSDVPQAKFHIKLPSGGDPLLRIDLTNSNGSILGSVINMYQPGSNTYAIFQSGSDLKNYFEGDIATSSNLYFTGSGSRVTITNNSVGLPFHYVLSTPPYSDLIPLTVYPTGIKVEDLLECNSFQLHDNAGLGKILVSDADGNGIWTDASSYGDDDWLAESKPGNGLYLNPKYDKVGIGTPHPTAKLEVLFNDEKKTGLILNQSSDTVSTNEIQFKRDSIEKWAIGSHLNDDHPNSFFIWNNNIFKTSFFIQDSGSVGINTVTPSAMLDVNGTLKASAIGINTHAPFDPNSTWKLNVNGGIWAREVKVTVDDFPDYVFASDYQLLSIHDYDKFINDNKHLPNLPSSEEVQKNGGVELGKMQTKLLEKIEEQALYIISLQKQIDELKQMIGNLKEN